MKETRLFSVFNWNFFLLLLLLFLFFFFLFFFFFFLIPFFMTHSLARDWRASSLHLCWAGSCRWPSSLPRWARCGIEGVANGTLHVQPIILSTAMFLLAKIMRQGQAKEKDAYSAAGVISHESISLIATVMSFHTFAMSVFAFGSLVNPFMRFPAR